MYQPINKALIITWLAVFILNSLFILPAQAMQKQISTHKITQHKSKVMNLREYLSYFYNRYSYHFDKYGMVFKTPNYGVSKFKPAQTAREILSLASYYKYRAMKGDKKARQIIKQAILDAYQELKARPIKSYSFSDAWAQMAMLGLIDQLPLLLKQQEIKPLYQHILLSAKDGILAADSENRAALSAVYWQAIIDRLAQKKLIDINYKKELDKLIYRKIKAVLDKDVDAAGWYKEGRPKKFNPHYQLITAMAFAAYAEMTGNIEFAVAAKKMVEKLRQLSFANGMIEARLGPRPIGLGAQFYLGMGILNYHFNFKDYAAYLNYAYGDRFFSDPNYPDRLEYHSTIKDSSPDYHDDISFSNLAELILLMPKFTQIKINPQINQLNQAKQIIKFNGCLVEQIDENYSVIRKGAPSPKKNQSSIIMAQTYNQPRLEPNEESKKLNKFLNSLKKYFPGHNLPLTKQSLNVLAAAYVYGGYNLSEIIDTIQHGPRAVHPTIPASSWRRSIIYQQYLNSLPLK